MQKDCVHVVGAGLAGSEAAFYLANQGIKVFLHEMRPQKLTEAHKTDQCAELVCSNSFKSKIPSSAPAMLKNEMRLMGSLILRAAEACEVPGGQALAVDRDRFSAYVSEKLKNHPQIESIPGEVDSAFEDGITLFATGPLTSESLSRWLIEATGEEDLYFYDAIAPILDASTIDPEACFLANRYGKGGEDAYLNCPLSQVEYEAFVDELLKGEKVEPKRFEKEKFFQGCQPIEAIAAGGRQSLRFGPMKPVGLTHPITGEKPYAVVQLRPENKSKTAYNMVGFQTKLKYPEQKRIFKMIPALRNVEFLRLGSIHRNTYLCGPRVFRPNLSLKGYPNVFLAGQITGVEGYLESAACGLLSSLFISQSVEKRAFAAPPANTALGALLRHIIGSDPKHYGPSNMHFGLFEPSFYALSDCSSKDETRTAMATQSLVNFQTWQNEQSCLNSPTFTA